MALLIFSPLSVNAWADNPQIDPTNRAQIEDFIIFTAQQEGVNVGLAVAIAKAESNLVWNAKNPASTASGIFQFINGTFKGYCIDKYGLATSMTQKNDVVIQTRCAMKILKEENGYKHWWASANGWVRRLPDHLNA